MSITDTAPQRQTDSPAEPQPFHQPGRRVEHRYTQTIHAPPDHVLGLICPVREHDWLDGWTCTLVYSASGLVEKGCIFTTGAGCDEEIWVVSVLDPVARIVEMVRVARAGYVCMLRVELEPAAGDSGRHGDATAAHITYTFTALDTAGSHAISERHSASRFLRMVTTWERSLDHYVTTGRQLPATTP